MQKHVWIVSEFGDNPDSVWDNRDDAIDRAAHLDRNNGCEDYSYIQKFILNAPEGWRMS